MCLNRDYIEKLLAREVTIFPEKNKSSKILLKIHENLRKAYQGSKRLNKIDKLPESKVKDV